MVLKAALTSTGSSGFKEKKLPAGLDPLGLGLVDLVRYRHMSTAM